MRSMTGRGQIEDLKRRELLMATVAVALFAACGDDGEEKPATDQTRRFTDSTGYTSEVPVRPQRIVAVGPPQWGAAQLLSLGAPLIGMSNFRGSDWPDYITTYFDMTGVRALGWADTTDVEAIAALKPDMIVAPARDGALERNVGVSPDLLRSIAALVAIDPFRAVEEVIGDYARLLNVRVDVLDGQRQQFETVLSEMRALLGDRWQEVTASSCWAGKETAQAWGPLDLPMNAIISRLGVRWVAPAQEAKQSGGFADVSLERLTEFDGDLMLYGTPQWSFDDNPLFQQLKVVQAGQVVRFPRFTFDGTHYPNYIACARYMLDQLRAMQPIRTDIL